MALTYGPAYTSLEQVQARLVEIFSQLVSPGRNMSGQRD